MEQICAQLDANQLQSVISQQLWNEFLLNLVFVVSKEWILINFHKFYPAMQMRHSFHVSTQVLPLSIIKLLTFKTT